MIYQTTYKLFKVYKQVYQIVNSIYEYVGKLSKRSFFP